MPRPRQDNGDRRVVQPGLFLEPRRKEISQSVLWLFVVLPLIAATSLAVFAIWAANRIDVITSDRESALLTQALADSLADFSKEQYTVTTWDDTLEKSRSADHDWLRDNAAEWLYDFFGHDEVIIVNASDEPIHAMVAGKAVPSDSTKRQVAQLKPTLIRLRNQLRDADDYSVPVVSGWTIRKGRPAMIGIRPILPSGADIPITAAEMYFHIDFKFIDGPVLADIGTRHQLKNVRFSPFDEGIPGGSNIKITATGKGTIGYVVWDSDRPGSALLRQTAPALCAVVTLLAMLIWWLLSRLRKAAEEIARRQRDAVHQAYHDPLTGLANRAMMNERLDIELLSHDSEASILALHYLDLDRFKHVNDTLGHPAGDNLIRQVADRLRASVGPTDLVARLGGDEFAIIQMGLTNRSEAAVLAENILRDIRLPFDLDGNQAFIDGSIGIALALPADSRADIVRRADIALYQVKGNGKGHHCFFERRFDDEQVKRHAIEMDLHRALDEKNGLTMMFQPFFAADGTTVLGAEALLRWNHPTLGELEPEVFVPIAEERGLMERLGAWVLEEAIRVAALANLPSLAINISAAQFRDEQLADKILDLAYDLKFSPSRLRLEITEGLLLSSAESVEKALTKLRFAGVHVSLDDFGTGYSSLNYLRRYKVDGIKIDRNFVQRLGAPDNTDAIVRAILDLANALLLDVVAEGVETEQQWDWLLAAGCTQFQGFLFANPLSVPNLCALCVDTVDVADNGSIRQSWAS